MPREARLFTQHTVAQSKPQAKPYELRDRGCAGLILRVQPSGAKLWYAALPAIGGRNKRNSLRPATGPGSITLTEARALALEYRLTHGGAKKAEPPRNPNGVPTLAAYLRDRYAPYFEAHHSKESARSDLNNLTMLAESWRKKGQVTRKDFKKRKRTWPDFSHDPIDALTSDRLDKWVEARLKVASAATVHRNVSILKTALNQAVSWGIIQASPLAHYRPPALKNADRMRQRYLQLDEEKRFRKALADKALTPPYFRTICLVALNTGMRLGEILKLQWRDVDFARALLTVRAENSKTNRVRYIPLNKEAFGELKGQLARERKASSEKRERGNPDSWVFPGLWHGRLKNTSKPWGAVLKAAEIRDFHFHDLRHTFASKVVSKGNELYTVTALLGHSDPKLTARYAHHHPDFLKKAVNSI